MIVKDNVKYEIFKLVAQSVIIRGGTSEHVPNDYKRFLQSAIDLGVICEDDEKTVANSGKRVLNVDNGRI